MSSPDQSAYTGLTLFDRNAYDLMQRAILDAQSKLPDWTPRVGSLEMVLLESISIMISESVYAINRLPDGILEGLIANFGIVRQLGSPAAAVVKFTVVDTTGYTIPSGTTVRLDLGNGTTVDFTTDSIVTVASGQTQVNASVTSTSNTDAANGTAVNTPLTITSPIYFLTSAIIQTAPSGGSGPESDDEWRTRAVTQFASLSSVLVQPKHFTAAALSQPGVGRATTLDNYNGTTSAAGHVTVAVADDDGLALSTGFKGTLQSLLDSEAMAALVVHVVDPIYNQVNVNVTVVKYPNYVTGTVAANVQDVLDLYLSPKSWQWDSTVYINELIALIDHVEGVDRVTSVAISKGSDTPAASNLTLDGPFSLTQAGTFNVTVS